MHPGPLDVPSTSHPQSNLRIPVHLFTYLWTHFRTRSDVQKQKDPFKFNEMQISGPVFYSLATSTYFINTPSYLKSFLLGILQNIIKWMFESTLVQGFLKCGRNNLELQPLYFKIRIYMASKRCEIPMKSFLTLVQVITLTIFRRISHLLGELLARIIRWDDKTSKIGSNMAIY